jgi:hypothetical protein
MLYGNYAFKGGYTDLLKKYRSTPDMQNKPKVATTTTTSQFTTPLLEKLKHSPYAAPVEERKERPASANIPIGLSERERTNMFNIGRGRIQTATNVAMEQMREKLGARGFRAGESGLADTILGKIATEGQRQLSDYGRQIESEEALRRFAERLEAGKFGLLEKESGLRERGFEYGQEMDAIRMLMALFGMGQQQQATGYAPYWQSILSYGG